MVINILIIIQSILGLFLVYKDLKYQKVNAFAFYLFVFLIFVEKISQISKESIFLSLLIGAILLFYLTKYKIGSADVILLTINTLVMQLERIPVYWFLCGVLGLLFHFVIKEKRIPFLPSLILSWDILRIFD